MYEYDHIEINGSLLQSKYGVYVVEVSHEKDGTYYYVGQTGDAKEITARSSFYRLAAHLGYRKNTQNQVYEGLKTKTGISDRYELEEWLNGSVVKMYFFKVKGFEPMETNPENKIRHHEKRRKTLALESALMDTGRARGLELLNKSGKTYKKYEDQISAAGQIWNKILPNNLPHGL